MNNLIQTVERLMNSSCKEDILIAFHLVKKHTGIKSSVVLFWWIDRRTKNPWTMYTRWNSIELDDDENRFAIYHSELED